MHRITPKAQSNKSGLCFEILFLIRFTADKKKKIIQEKEN